ncbi:MAG: redox-regulated ATPase YchF [Candidatus Nealsonbacteria bacterium CG10_big_fil_rev_8_21_14_0_10_36_24]|uniref:Redox-regulated ATPase YchF n=2 Tax=Candidatus Nealsoniibacteriota TaxID=1817911 RepID=A0A2H0YN50_9BACT|nr:MAG: redox-regulated ATPase YchF [Candidatus Nealsonbacteria bacterium CG10_big_fil_rev_8_21_14_0_10_36_24]PIS39880.1 MAG: redox-regulated ATPase YchF [Candidatus Nealsonbacteria bacterium CG08_land_8_20_14_0_20_36_22]
MSFSVGIIGLPNVGKSTLFKALTKKQVDIADYPFTTINPNIGVVVVPDERLEKIAKIVQPEKITPTVIKFVDIAGLVKGAHQGEGLGNQFLSYIRPCDAIVEIIRVFKAQRPGEEINPEKDIEIIETELLMKDQEIGDNVLTSKPKIYLFNTQSSEEFPKMNLKDEADMSELSEEEIKELGFKSQLDQLILACYNILGLITFFTITGGKEARAWTLKKGSNIIKAAEKVHSDFAEKFIKAEVIPWQKLIETDSWLKARETGKIKTAGKEYLVQDGDVIEFKI